MYNFETIHKDIIEKIILFNKSYYFTNTEIIIEKIKVFLAKHKIICFQYGKFSQFTEICSGNKVPNNYLYIIFINIHGDVYGSIYIEKTINNRINNVFDDRWYKKILNEKEYVEKDTLINPEDIVKINNNKIFEEISNDLININDIRLNSDYFIDNICNLYKLTAKQENKKIFDIKQISISIFNTIKDKLYDLLIKYKIKPDLFMKYIINVDEKYDFNIPKDLLEEEVIITELNKYLEDEKGYKLKHGRLPRFDMPSFHFPNYTTATATQAKAASDLYDKLYKEHCKIVSERKDTIDKHYKSIGIAREYVIRCCIIFKIFEIATIDILKQFDTKDRLDKLLIAKRKKFENANLNLFDICFLQYLPISDPYDIHNFIYQYGYYSFVGCNNNGESTHITNCILSHNFHNIFDDIYKNNISRKELINNIITRIKEEENTILNKITELKSNIIINITHNILTICNYYKEELNLADFIDVKMKDIMKKGEMTKFKFIDIDEIHITNSNMKIIKMDFTQRPVHVKIKKFEIINCKKFKSFEPNFAKKIMAFYLDSNLISKFDD